MNELLEYLMELKAEAQKYAEIAYGKGPSICMVDGIRWCELSSQVGLISNIETFIHTGEKRSVIAIPLGASVDW